MNDNRLSVALCLCTLLLCGLYGLIGVIPDLLNPAFTSYEHVFVSIVLFGYTGVVLLAFGLGLAYAVLTRGRMA